MRILNYHEIVNDTFGGEAIAVTFCPLCGTGMAFLAGQGGRRRTFGVSGLLYNSDVLLYDRETQSLWSQLMRQAVSGSMKGTMLEQVALTHTTWRDWRRRHPETRVLSVDTGFSRDYWQDPYAGYSATDGTYFPVNHLDRRYHPKERVMGVELHGAAKVYPFAELSKLERPLCDRLAGRRIRVEFDPANQTARVLDEYGEEIPSTIGFWFAWMTFYPDSAVFQTDR